MHYFEERMPRLIQLMLSFVAAEILKSIMNASKELGLISLDYTQYFLLISFGFSLNLLDLH